MKFTKSVWSSIFAAALVLSFVGCTGSTAPTTKPSEKMMDKMGGDKMGGDKMGGDKMGGDKMGGDKMGDKK